VRVRGTEAKVGLEARNLAPEIAELSMGNPARTSSSGGAENLGKFEVVGRKEWQLSDFDPLSVVPQKYVASRLGGDGDNPHFFVSVAFKRTYHCASPLFATCKRWYVSVASKRPRS